MITGALIGARWRSITVDGLVHGELGADSAVLTMQDAILALQVYWTGRGCLLAQPFNSEVGAGTMNPATILRVLGPEPWHVAYVEPSVRPDDSRYGENPNRLQTHTQFQVILKPDPGNPQEVFLGSLRALGIDIDAHDIRFVEDNWASPALGAWGLGWEVWLDGLEITQFTYFQQAGGQTVDPVAVEITYGLERILMAIQGVSHFRDIAYSADISYGEVFGQSEYEMSRYYLDEADLDANRKLFEEYATEASRLIERGLPVPAHAYVLRCSHTFNVLDARGAISTTERARAFARMRGLAREVSVLWAKRREELGHPLGVVAAPEPAAVPSAAAAPETPAGPAEPATLLFEIGTEELPPGEVTRSAAAVAEALRTKLAATRLGHGEIATYSTPRRIVATIADVQPAEPDARRTMRGPRVTAAYDSEGQPTKAASGFARGRGIDVDQLERVTENEVEYIAATVVDLGRNAVTVLSDILAEVVSQLRAEKNMRWRDPKLSFSRPIRWLVAVWGDVPVPVVCSTLAAGTTTRVHRTAAEPEVAVPGADRYVEFLDGHGIVVDSAVRRDLIVTSAASLAAEVGGIVDSVAESALVDEITNLVESPHALLGRFDRRYLELPEEVLTTVMRKHQRYLPVRDGDGGLLPYFVAVANGSCDDDVVRAGNEAVLRARYEDASFFWNADVEVAPERFRADLAKLTFAEKLGSMADRADRIAAVAQRLAGVVGGDIDHETVQRAGQLAKFDLASQLVIELSSLAGTMAAEYARRAGETEAVATALLEMELPRQAGDRLPASTAGAILALADRFDLVVGLLAVGVKPSGSSDPYGLRRAALGIVAILRAWGSLSEITVRRGLEAAADIHGVPVSDDVLATATDLIVRRYEQQLLDTGADYRLVRATLSRAQAPAVADAVREELVELADDSTFTALTEAIQRVRRILPKDVVPNLEDSQRVQGERDKALNEPAEIALHEAISAVLAQPRPAGLRDFVAAASVLTGPINVFFDEILVMDPDPAVRQARLELLAAVAGLADGVLDWDALTT